MSDELLGKIYDKVDKLSGDMETVKVEQAEMRTDLKYHIKRTDMLEDLYKDIKEKDLDPIKAHVDQVRAMSKLASSAAKIITVASGAVGLILGVLKLLHRI